MTSPRLVAITVHLPEEWVHNLEALVDPDLGLDDVAAVLAELADHAQQGVYRPGSWERGWLCQALGYEWLERLEPDPEHPAIFERPRQRTTTEGHAATSSETGPAAAGKREGQLDPLAPSAPTASKPRLTATPHCWHPRRPARADVAHRRRQVAVLQPRARYVRRVRAATR